MFTIKKRPVYTDLNGEQTHLRSIRVQDLDGYKLSDIPDYIKSKKEEFTIPNAEVIRIGETYIYVHDYDYDFDVSFNVEVISKFKQEYIDEYEAVYAQKLADYEAWYFCNKVDIEAELERRKQNTERDKRIASIQKQIEELKEAQRQIKQGG